MDNMIPVEGMDGFYRDIHSGAIINKNTNDYRSYVKKREKMKQQQENFSALKDEVDSLKSDMNDIKSMLISITDILNK